MSTTPDPLFTILDELPRLSATSNWTDYVELRALTSEDGSYSNGNLSDVEATAEDIATDVESPTDDVALADEASGTEAGKADKLALRWDDIKRSLQARSRRFGPYWPFVLQGNVLRLRYDTLAPCHRLYLALLIASSLRYVTKSRAQEVTDALEMIGQEAFKALMPQHWKVTVFGKNSTSYPGTKLQKLNALAKDLRLKLLAVDEEVNGGDSGDGGIDLVAWHPFRDKLGHLPIAFAQCTAMSGDTTKKQAEASPEFVRRWFEIQHPSANYFFSCHDYRKPNGTWQFKPIGAVVIDRGRLLEMADLYELSGGAVAFVAEALRTNEPVAA